MFSQITESKINFVFIKTPLKLKNVLVSEVSNNKNTFSESWLTR